MSENILFKGREIEFKNLNDGSLSARLEQNSISYHSAAIDQNHIRLTAKGKTHSLYAAKTSDALYVFHDGRQYVFEVANESVRAQSKKSNSSSEVASPMPGNIVKILCEVGDEVKENDILLIVEAMKMETPLRAMTDGVVKKILCEEGKQISGGELLIEFEK